MEFLVLKFKEILRIHLYHQVLEAERFNIIRTRYDQAWFQFQYSQVFTLFRFLPHNRKPLRHIIQRFGNKLISCPRFQEKFDVCCSFIVLQSIEDVIDILSRTNVCISLRHANRSIRINIFFFPFFRSDSYRIILNSRFIRIVQFERNRCKVLWQNRESSFYLFGLYYLLICVQIFKTDCYRFVIRIGLEQYQVVGIVHTTRRGRCIAYHLDRRLHKRGIRNLIAGYRRRNDGAYRRITFVRLTVGCPQTERTGTVIHTNLQRLIKRRSVLHRSRQSIDFLSFWVLIKHYIIQIARMRQRIGFRSSNNTICTVR